MAAAATQPAGTEALDAMEGAARYHAYLTEEIEAAFGAGGRSVIDFGAGIGTIASRLDDGRRQLRCVEPDDSARSALVRAGLTAVASLDELPLGWADGAVVVNVLEHVVDDAAVLRKLGEHLVLGGRLFVWVPAGDWLYSKFDASVGHVRRYSAGNLRRTLESAGFDVIDVRYADPLGVIAAALYKWGRQSGSLNSNAVRLYDRLVFPFSRSLQPITGKLLGKNLLAVAQLRSR
jgi:SAM-dependent methyltransferase